ncbi:hypothetical protein Zm00014a_027288 [Zea mays]|uniref:Uncharacterized protein n=1 Tax=Zea mays TaxID=4577 RepID=A0A317Y3N5_MAIZE|nr:hypothetical protein Zm00014a_027288 [Zea mays]
MLGMLLLRLWPALRRKPRSLIIHLVLHFTVFSMHHLCSAYLKLEPMFLAGG